MEDDLNVVVRDAGRDRAARAPIKVVLARELLRNFASILLVALHTSASLRAELVVREPTERAWCLRALSCHHVPEALGARIHRHRRERPCLGARGARAVGARSTARSPRARARAPWRWRVAAAPRRSARVRRGTDGPGAHRSRLPARPTAHHPLRVHVAARLACLLCPHKLLARFNLDSSFFIF